MKKKILTFILAGFLAAGIFGGTVPACARGEKLTLHWDTKEGEEKEFLDQLLEEYRELTGTEVTLVLGEGDVYKGSFSEMEEAYKKGNLCNLAPYMEKESPYSDSVTWGAALSDDIQRNLQVYKNEIPGYPAGRTAARIFCNEVLFLEAGAEIPNTWSEFRKVCEVMAEKGITPFVFPEGESRAWQWLMNGICNQLDHNLAELLDETEDSRAELAEVCKGADDGRMDYGRPQIQEALQYMKEFYSYCEISGGKPGDEAALEVFAEGKAAMVFAANQEGKRLGDEFSWRAVPIPAVTEELSEYALGQSVLAGGEAVHFYGVNYGLTKNKERLNAALDFVQYMTSESVQEQMAEKLYILPSAKKARIPEDMKDFQIVEESMEMPYFTGLDEENRNEIREYTTEYLEGGIKIASLTEKLNQSCQEASRRICEKNGWNLVNNYGMPTAGECTKCEP